MARATWIGLLAEVKPGADAVITADPTPTPLICAGVCENVFPAAIKIAGVTVATVVLLLAIETVTPPAGAAVLNVTGRIADWLTPTVRLEGREIAPEETLVTVTVAFAPGIPGALAVILTDPAEMPVTGTEMLVTPAAKLRVAGTVATAGLLELKFTASPVDMDAESCKTRFPVAPLLIVRLPAEKLNVGGGVGLPPVTWTGALAVG